jgi:hypothetical protein
MNEYPEVTFWIEHEFKSLVQDKLTPWMFLNTGKMTPVKDVHGRTIRYVGVEFQGSPATVFWNGFVEPFLEALFPRAFDTAIAYATKSNIDPEPVITHVHGSLTKGIRDVYMKMQDIDPRPRGKVFPDRVPPRSVVHEVAAMEDKLRAYYVSALERVPRSDTKLTDALELKPGIWGFALDIRKLWKWTRKRPVGSAHNKGLRSVFDRLLRPNTKMEQTGLRPRKLRATGQRRVRLLAICYAVNLSCF